MFRLFRALDANRRNLTDHNIWRKDQTKVCVAVCRSKKLPRQLRPIAGFLQQKFFLNKIYFSLAQEPQEQHKCRLFETCIFAPKIVARLFFLLAFLPVLFAFLPQLLPLSRFALICLRGIILYTKIFSCGSTSKAYKINIFHCIYWLNVKAFGIHLFFLFRPLSLLIARESDAVFIIISFVPFARNASPAFYIKLIIDWRYSPQTQTRVFPVDYLSRDSI